MVPSSESAGLLNAINRLGEWPDAATVEQYCESLQLARREMARVRDIATRYARRFNLPDDIDAAPARLQARYAVIKYMFEARVEHSWLLIHEPIGGSA